MVRVDTWHNKQLQTAVYLQSAYCQLWQTETSYDNDAALGLYWWLASLGSSYFSTSTLFKQIYRYNVYRIICMIALLDYDMNVHKLM